MMKKSKIIVGSIAISFLLTACDTVRKQDVGLVTGGVLGAVVGSQIGGGTGKVVATAAGAVLGGLIGKSIGEYMDRQDRIYMNQALESTRTYQTKTWTNPDTGNRYSVTPVKTYRGQTGQPCREFRTKAYINGKEEKLYGRACRDSRGYWKVIR